MRTGGTFHRMLIVRVNPRLRQSILAAGVAFAVGACGSGGTPAGLFSSDSSDLGGVISDEPRSALIGRDILSSGGNAVDAAVATYFALSVTYPGAASLGGGGICIAFRGREEDIEAIDFKAKRFEKDGKVAMVPGAVRGMFALHARYGRLKWETLLLPAERLARFGNPVSRAFARRLAAVPPGQLMGSAVRRLFFPSGEKVGEGHFLSQLELSASLSRIRLYGPGGFYAGDFAKQLAQGIGAAVGMEVPVSVLRDYRPKWLTTQKVGLGKDELHLPANKIGTVAAEIWRGAIRQKKQAPHDSAGFISIDSQGGGAACVVSTNGMLGARRMIASSGILMAAPPSGDVFSGVPMLLINRPLKDVRGAAAGSGGVDGTIRAVATAKRVFDDGVPIDRAFGPLDGREGRANVIHCPKGARENTKSCWFGSDPAGDGLAASAAL